ncbi:MAG TPA: hypothetical protein IAA32_06490 [Candidatus Butyricicoccus stercorigallinarum]|nr:hypothetical protein [Candidatus Butyricicoccus stercorigallinarum]
MKRRKNNLDERQEQELLHIEHLGMCFCFWALIASVAVQSLAGAPWEQVAAEWTIFMVLAVGLVIACARRGIWDRHWKPNTRTNAALSAAAGLAVAVFVFCMMQRNTGGGFFAVSAGLSAVMGLFTFALCFAVMTVTARLTLRRQRRLEQLDCDEDE